jgi:EAL domain-containing protein (putative c-di-GMP-specific phosphodiesterase class I)
LQVRRRDFAEHCRKLLDGWSVRVPGYGIDMELGEAAFLQDVEGTARKLSDLRHAGVRVVLDHFGIGYSSLGLLSRLPLDVIKIDRSLVRDLHRDPGRRALVGSIIGMASALNLESVAEGVETPEQVAVLEELKCPRWQGVLFSTPVRGEELERLLAPASR